MRKMVLKRTLFVLTFMFLIAGALGCYQIVRVLQVSYITTLGWENDRYLWGAGAGGAIRWDVNEEAVVYNSFRPDGIEQFFVTEKGQVWAYGQGVWRFENGNWIEHDEATGLEHGRINEVIQTKDGTIWVATWAGFKTWDEKGHIWVPTSINQPAQTLVESPNGTLWFGLVQDGIVEKRPSGEIVHWTNAEGLVDNHIKSILIASNGDVWVGTQDGVSRWDGKRWEKWYDFGVLDPDGLIVYKLHETTDGNIWASTSQDLAKWDGERWTTYQSSPFCLPNFTFLQTDNGNLWAGCPTGLFGWTGSSWREYGPSQGISDNSFARLIQGGNGVLYAHTKSGLYQYIPEQDRWESFPGQQPLLNRLIPFWW